LSPFKDFKMKKVTIFNKRVIIILFVCFAPTFLSCKDKITKIELINKNPIEYTFNFSKDSLYKVITNDIILMRLPVMTIKNKRIIPPEILELLLMKNNEQDIFLWSVGDHWKSKIYKKKKGEFLDYFVSFYLHLEKIDEYHTKVSIKTIEPKVIVGMELFPSPPHFVRNNKTIAMEPSTIEEFEILLEIGKLIGEKDMPALNLPNEKNQRMILK